MITDRENRRLKNEAEAYVNVPEGGGAGGAAERHTELRSNTAGPVTTTENAGVFIPCTITIQEARGRLVTRIAKATQ